GAQHLMRANDKKNALKIYEALYNANLAERYHLAAYRGMILCNSGKTTKLLTAARLSNNRIEQTAALQLVHELPGAEVTKAVAEVLPKLQPDLQASLIGGLGQRIDTAATPAIISMLGNASAAVRLSAIKALGP